MLEIEIQPKEYYDEERQEFVKLSAPVLLKLEHSLISVSRWESKWKKRFLSRDKKTPAEMLDYVRCMTINRNVPPEVYDTLSVKELSIIREYIDDPATATTFSKSSSGRAPRTGEETSSELIYYWMTVNNIPFECEKWNLNRLLTLINICAVKNQPSKKMSKQDTIRRNASLNKARRKAHGTRG